MHRGRCHGWCVAGDMGWEVEGAERCQRLLQPLQRSARLGRLEAAPEGGNKGLIQLESTRGGCGADAEHVQGFWGRAWGEPAGAELRQHERWRE